MKRIWIYLLMVCSLSLIVVESAYAQFIPETCDNGVDDNGDGLIDCNDPQCNGAISGTPVSGCEGEFNCNNGIDDDGDGFIDYYDGDCLNDPDNPNDYIVIQPGCEAAPVGNVFDMQVAWRSENGTSYAYGMPAVGDIDNDGIPEIVTANEKGRKLYILEGDFDGAGINQPVAEVNVSGTDLYAYPTIGDVDRDEDGEIFIMDRGGRIRCFDHNLNLIWGGLPGDSPAEFRSCYTDFGSALGLADFNQDGTPELYYGNEIRNPIDGQLLIKGSHGDPTKPYTLNNWETELNGAGVAVDILPNEPGLELVLGSIIYSVNISNTSGTAGNSLVEKLNMDTTANLPPDYPSGGYRTKLTDFGENHSTTSVVDYDQDGHLDVIMAGSGTSNSGGPTTIYYWNIKKKFVKSFLVADPTCDPSNPPSLFDNQCTWKRGAGSINVADIDGDGELECTFASAENLYALETDFSLKWVNASDFQEGSSGFTGTSVFDFDGDGSSEIIYRDELRLYVVNGTDGSILGTFSQDCQSQTQAEYPIVADVDNDGETEIVCSCRGEDNLKSHIAVFKAGENQYWVPARSVWNQKTYFNVNVNDNLTIPQYQQLHHLNFAEICNDPKFPKSFALNKFLNQSPRISYCGRLVFPSPLLNFTDDLPTIDPPVCPDNEFTVTLHFINEGDEPVNKPIPIAFYEKDPTGEYDNTDPNPWLDTVYVNVPGGLQVGQKLDTTLTITGARGAHTLYVSLNDIGPFDKTTLAPLANEIFYPLDSLNGTVRECDNTPTIISVNVVPRPFDIQAEVISENRKCPGGGTNNGEVNVLAEDGSAIPNSDYNFEWYKIKSPADILVGNTAAVTNLDSGYYYVIVTHATYGCSSNADTVQIQKIEDWPDAEDVTAEMISKVSSCKPGTADGVARVLINGGPIDEILYTVNWIDEQSQNPDDPIAVGDTATGLTAKLYNVEVINNLTGCSETTQIDMSLPIPKIDTLITTSPVNCKNPNGSINVQVEGGGSAGTYDFMLINLSTQKDTIQDNGSFTGLAAGLYEVRVINEATQCGQYTPGTEVNLKSKKSIPDVTLSVEKEQTACVAPYTGQLKATTKDGNYTYAWYRGTVTSGPSSVLVGGTQLTPDTLSTYITDVYTLIFTDNDSECDTTVRITLPENVTPPALEDTDAVITPLTSCDPSNPNGAIDVSVDSVKANYIFRLYEGTNTSTPPAYVEATDGIFNNLGELTKDRKYTIEAISTITGCATVIPLTVTVPDSTADPVIVKSSWDNQTSCDNTKPNGWASVTADGSTSTTDYTFVWKDLSGNTLSNLPTVDSLAEGNYQITVINKTTKCSAVDVIPIDEVIMEGEDLVLTLTPKDRADCSPFNGEMEVTEVNGDPTQVANYTYTWYRVDDPGIDSTVIAGVTGPIITGKDIGLFSVMAVNNNTNCLTATYADSIRNAAVEPTINIQPEQEMTNCIDPDGKFSVKAVDPTGTVDVDEYIYDWYLGKDTIPENHVHTGQVVENARAARYTVVVTDPNTLCKSSGYHDLKASPGLLPVFVKAQAIPSLTCNRPDGAVEAEVDTLVGKGDSQSDYEFYWYIGSSATPKAGGKPGDVDFTAADHSGAGDFGRFWNDLPAGEYTLVVYYAPDGCQSDFKTVKVVDIAQPPVLSVINNDPNTLCITPGNGLLEIKASKAPKNGNYPGDTTINSGYTFEWTHDPVVTTDTIDTRNNLYHGNYTVTVTDIETDCPNTKTFTVANNTQLPIITAIATVPQQNCVTPEGSVEVTNMEAGSTNVLAADMAADYNFHWYDEESDFNDSNFASGRIALDTAGAVNNTILTGLNPEDYFVVAEHAVTGCFSFPEEGEVEDNTPEVEIYLNAKEDFITCTGVNEGLVEVRVDGTTTSPPYTINWYAGAGTANDITGTASITNTPTTSRIDDLQDGTYTVLIEENASQCMDSATFTINKKVRKPILMASKISDQTICLPNGGISVDAITLGGNSENFNDYDYTWYQGSLDANGENNFTSGAYAFTADGLEVSELTADVYFVTATKVNPGGMTGCDTEPYQIIIEDTSVPLMVTLDDISDPITACDPSNKAEGEIEIEVRNSANYTIQWFTGTDTTDPANQLVAFNDEEEVEDLVPGYYTAWVQDPATGCEATRTYEIIGIAVPVTVATSASPYTSCIAPNGIIAANANGGSGVYNYTWYVGEDTTVPPMQVPNTQSVVDQLVNGTYTVVVTDRNEPVCQAIAAEIVVEDERGRDIMVNIVTDFPVTNCDVSNPNGQLSASIDGPMSQYSFFWYEGTNTGTNPLAQGPILANVPAQEYTVVVRDRITGCLSNSFSATVEEGEMVLPPLTDVQVTAQQTHCLVPNGAAMALLDEASADPNVDYIYTWYAQPNANGQPIYTSSRSNEILGLDEGEFSVTVTNVLTGCVSEPAPFVIEEILKYPDFEITTTPATCAESNGTASIVFTEQIDVVEVEWYTPIGYDYGFSLQGYPSGEYEVTLTDGKGCSTTKTATIEANIHVYNGVSPNGDGRNDTFIINCIENFENNLVKIFNRAGALVYENNNYDNEIIYFKGIGNRGLYIGGQELPDGTYFYIIDKQNGDKPESGYLELLR